MEGSGRAEFATSKYAFWDIDYFKLVVFKKQDSGKTLDLSPNCIKRIKTVFGSAARVTQEGRRAWLKITSAPSFDMFL